jgi:hypothetical protein
VTGALARIITHWQEVAAPYGCHFENYLARRSFKMTTRPSDLPNFPYW